MGIMGIKYKLIIGGCNHGVKTIEEIAEYFLKMPIDPNNLNAINLIPCHHENDFYDYKDLEFNFYQKNLDNKEFNTDGYELNEICGHYEQE